MNRSSSNPPGKPREPLSVLIVNHHSPGMGGADVYVRYLAEGLARLGIPVGITWPTDRPTPQFTAETSTMGPLLIPCGYRSVRDIRFRFLLSSLNSEPYRAMRVLCEKYLPAVVHVNQAFDGDGIDLIRACVDSGSTRVFGTIHLQVHPPGANRVLAWGKNVYLRPFYSRFPYTKIFPSARQRDSFSAAYNDESRLFVIPNGIILPPIPGANEIEDRKVSLGLSGKVVIAYAGRMVEGKGVEILVDAFLDARKKIPELFLLLIGDGRQRSRVESTLRKEIGDTGWMCTGWVGEVSGYLSCTDLLVLPSRFESMPLSLIEALSIGVPCLSSRYDGIEELLDLGARVEVMGRLDRATMTLKLVQILSSVEIHRARVIEGREVLRKRFDCRRMAQDTARLYGLSF